MLEPGGRSSLSVGIHCGVRVFDRPLNGRIWETSEAAGVLDWVPADWPVDPTKPDGPLTVEVRLSDDGDSLTLSLNNRDVEYVPTGTAYTDDQLCQ